jgi:leucyl aminopeptidase
MLSCFIPVGRGDTRPILAVPVSAYPSWLASQPAETRAWLEGSGFEAKAARAILLPRVDGAADSAALVVLSEPAEPWDFAALRARLPGGDWHLEAGDAFDFGTTALGWALASYRFERYRKSEAKPARLALAADPASERATAIAEAICLGRDLINTPAGDLGPAELAAAAADLAARFDARLRIVEGQSAGPRGHRYPGRRPSPPAARSVRPRAPPPADRPAPRASP